MPIYARPAHETLHLPDHGDASPAVYWAVFDPDWYRARYPDAPAGSAEQLLGGSGWCVRISRAVPVRVEHSPVHGGGGIAMVREMQRFMGGPGVNWHAKLLPCRPDDAGKA